MTGIGLIGNIPAVLHYRGGNGTVLDFYEQVGSHIAYKDIDVFLIGLFGGFNGVLEYIEENCTKVERGDFHVI